ncbi:MAG: DUF481 domain-containing protein [Cyclobacteriaceae bacterium]|nr:DUF481 domain-containing protein [Cyclobacteriaceae bacterium]
MKPFLATYIIIFTLSISWVRAQKTDTVTLFNGDRITCEIINLSKGKLHIKTSDMSNINITWAKISSIESTHKYEIILNDHSVYYGKFSKGIPGTSMVSFGVFQELVSLQEITSLVQINSSFWKQLNGSLDAGFSYTKGNDNLQFNSSGEIKHRSERFLNTLNYNSVITENSQRLSKKQDGGYSLKAFHKKSSFSIYNIVWEQNTELGIENRASLNVRFGLTPIDNSSNLLDISAGLLLNREFDSEQNATNNTEGIINITYDFFLFTKPDIDLTTSLIVYPSFTVKNRLRSEYNFRVRWKVFHNFTLNFKYYFTYDNKPPTEGALTFDYGVNTSIGYSF